MSAVVRAYSGMGFVDDESRRIVSITATVQADAQKYDEKFRRAFLHMIDNPQDKGLMSTHLFYDIPRDPSAVFSKLSYDARHILSGGDAWERRVREAVQNNSQSGFWSKDQSVTSYAVQQGLVNKLPAGAIKFLSYGGGDIHAFTGNEMQIMGAAFKVRANDIVEFCAVDILERFAKGCALVANDAFGIDSQGVLGDFIYNGRLALSDTAGTPVVMIFGGSFENTPYIKDGLSPVDATALAWAKLSEQHGMGATVIKTFDTNRNHDLVNGPYAPKGPFEAFLLSGFARATQQKIIQDPQYDVFKNWRMTSVFNEKAGSIELAAECKTSHDVMIDGSMRSFVEGEQRVITLSHKWSRAVQEDIARRAGFEFETIEEPGNPNMLIVARAVREPDKELLRLVNNS